MKWHAFIFTASVAAASIVTPLIAADKSDYQTAKLTDLRREDTGSGTARAQGSFCLALELDDMTYLVRHEAYWRWSYEPSDLVVDDPVKVKIKSNDLFIQRPKGGDLKTRISRRERHSPEKSPMTCGTPVVVSR
jgi:hypothetical protein